MKFNKIYIEITNICNLKCDFCPPQSLKKAKMDLAFFEQINIQAKAYTNEVTYHLMGDPLVVSNLNEYLDISHKVGLKVHLTTTAINLTRELFSTLAHPAIKQINFSLNSYNANTHKITLQEYLSPIFAYSAYKIEHQIDQFINFRLWNNDITQSAQTYNALVLEYINTYFNLQIEKLDDKSTRIANKVLINYDHYFEWPSLDNPIVSTSGSCYGLESHIGVLVDGTVVPCCLDKDGVMTLGNLHEKSLSDILHSQKAKEIRDGFHSNTLTQELCQKCKFRVRFED